MIKKIAVGAAIGLGLFGGIATAQMFGNFPIVGGSSYSCGSVNGVSNCTVPAGPTALTGDEMIPADTYLSQGRSPQTVKVPITKLGAGLTTFNTPVTTDNILITAQTRQLIVTPAGTIAAMTLTFPTAALLAQSDGSRFGFCTTQIITTLTVTAGSGTTVSNAPSAMLVPVATGGASCVEWIYRLSNTTWYRVQ